MSVVYPRRLSTVIALYLGTEPPPILELKSTGKKVYRMRRYGIPGSIQSPEIDAALEHSAKLLDDPFADEPPEVTAAIARVWREALI